jgi:hypothetical protein
LERSQLPHFGTWDPTAHDLPLLVCDFALQARVLQFGLRGRIETMELKAHLDTFSGVNPDQG